MEKTVLLIGAGASKASSFALPTMEGFFGNSIDQLPTELQNLLVWFYPRIDPTRYNLEEVLSYLFGCLKRWRLLSKEDRSVTAHQSYDYDELLRFIAKQLRIPDGAWCDLHVKLFLSLGPEDTILTVNYDLVGDQSLKFTEKKESHGYPKSFNDLKQQSRMYKLRSMLGPPDFIRGQPPSLLPREEESGFYLKLHGSLDWIWCPNSQCANSRRFYCVGLESAKSGQEPDKPCRLCGTPLSAFLVPPVAIKSIEPEGIITFVWTLALQELRRAKRLVIFGMSFAPSDQELRWLIRQSNALRQNEVEISIINPKKSDRETTKQLFPRDTIVREFENLEEYLNCH